MKAISPGNPIILSMLRPIQ